MGERGALGARERILAAATDLAGREGLEALTTRRVARVAGVNVGLLHYYFESKESLIDETLGLFLDEMLATAIATPAA
ncbi:MAG: helix-turn-helix domain containing protein, partial [Treponema sp.]|nr:helix-turn-helix domain containing protein [Treponema sp.]